MSGLSQESLMRVIEKINETISSQRVRESHLQGSRKLQVGIRQFEEIITEQSKSLSSEQRSRIHQEYFGLGPVTMPLGLDSVTEVLINSQHEIWMESKGKLENWPDQFLSELTYKNFLMMIYSEMGSEPSLVQPFVDGFWRGFRVHAVGQYHRLTPEVRVSLRKSSALTWSLNDLQIRGWADERGANLLRKFVKDRHNILVLGSTGSGKTTVIKALLTEVSISERVVVLEDTAEITPPNRASTRLLTRSDSQIVLPAITLSDLVKQSLRMRPDRLVVGEVRSVEAKDLLMALATGHEGSMGTIHAADPHQAILRLEMLVQMGAPQWSLTAIRRLLFLSLQIVVTCEKDSDGNRRLRSVHRLSSVEESGITLHTIYDRHATDLPRWGSLNGVV